MTDLLIAPWDLTGSVRKSVMPLLLPHLADEWGNANLVQNSLYEINAQNKQSKAKQPPPSDRVLKHNK